MTVDDAIAAFCSRDHSMKHTAIFFMGDASDLHKSSDALRQDIWEESKHRIPMPFSDITLLMSRQREQAAPIYFGFRLREKPLSEDMRTVTEDLREEHPGALRLAANKKPLQEFHFTYISPNESLTWTSQYMGIDPIKGLLVGSLLNSDDSKRVYEVAGGSSTWLKYVALISHPAHYIIKETPLLTPKEARRIEQGKQFPHAKRPRYIIVDHDVLVNRLKPTGTHASPAPHQRRGHWMRLAEQCKHARARGIEKVWVRDCKVGETDFIAEGRRYQVLLDFQDKMKDGTLSES